jgi:hypothetical protein
MRCLGAERETVHLSWNTPEDWGDCYLDRETGVLVELYRVHKFTNPVTGEIVEKADVVKLTSTKLWSAGASLTTEQLLTLITLTAIDVALLIAAIIWNRRRKRVEKRKKEA